jgi:hypothetical protein
MRRGVAHRAVHLFWLCLLVVLPALSPASGAPARLRVSVTREGVTETRVIDRTFERRSTGGVSGEPVSIQGNGWRLEGVVSATDSRSAPRLAPRGTGLLTFFAAIGLAVGFVNNEATPIDVTLSLCIDPLPVGATSTYGGSIAGAILDGDGDGNGTIATNAADDPIYELRVRSALCDVVSPGAVTTVDTLYDDPQAFNMPGAFQGANIGEQVFGAPIPNQAGPLMSTGFEMLVRFSITRRDFVGFTASGVVDGELLVDTGVGATTTSRTFSPPGAASSPPVAALVPRGFPTPSAAVGPVYILAIANGDSTDSDPPPAPTPTPTPVATPFNRFVTVPVNPPIAAPSRNGGIVLGSVTDFSGGTCTVRTKTSLPLYRASMDGTQQFTLYDNPTSFTASGYRSSLIAPQSFGTTIPNAAGPAASTNLRLDLDYEFLNDCLASFLAVYVVAACADPTYDADGNGEVQPLTDGIMILRYMFGFTGTSLITGALGSGATRTDPAAIKTFLDCLAGTMLDVDDNDALSPLTDGLLVLRRLFGFTGASLTTGAIGAGAQRTDAAAVTTYMNQFIP